MDLPIVDKFTTHLKNALTRALCLVVESGQPAIRPAHLLWALGMEKGSIGAEILQHVRLDAKKLALQFEKASKETFSASTEKKGTIPPFTTEARRAMEKAVLAASTYRHPYVGTEHLLAGLLQINGEDLREIFASQKIPLPILHQHVLAVLKSTSRFPDLAASVRTEPTKGLLGRDRAEGNTPLLLSLNEEPRPDHPEQEGTPALDYFGRDLTAAERNAKHSDPLVGRDREVRRVIEILSRRTKNNPLLLGEPGVGKTAIVEGLARRLAHGDVPIPLRGKRIVAIDLALLVAGTMYRGEFEARLRQLVEETKRRDDVILFIDEAHLLVGAGSASGSMDAANLLKPALARGELRCIGATTPAEYKKHLEADAALERRFQPVWVEEPTREETLAILKGVREGYEQFHHVRVSDEVLETIVRLSVRYFPDRRLPDKAIDLLDETAAAVRVRAPHPSQADRLRLIEDQLRTLHETKQRMVSEERYQEALALKEEERQLQETLATLLPPPQDVPCSILSESDVLDVVARTARLPVGEAAARGEHAFLHSLEKRLTLKIKGQSHAVKTVADAIRRSLTGISHPGRPLASFLFVGPSGVGKTELARAMAEAVFEDPRALLRLDMSEFAEPHSVSKLLGSPAGYIGYREPARLADQVRQRPSCILVFDELEKAHPDVQGLLLQILEEGELSDASGRPVNFCQTVIVLTTNAGWERLRGSSLGFTSDAGSRQMADDEQLRRELEETFRPELVNRLDGICVFNPLDQTALRAIAELRLEELIARLRDRRAELSVGRNVSSEIARRAEKSPLGAREIRRVIQAEIEPRLAEVLLETSSASRLRLKFGKTEFCIETLRE
ncbi:MAG TPA: ATP-dependent Clp protease ATP-binding subunit [Patescibacteria group bacterium]|nr:ATP-dependent Clp protease ATP-binding subunit [Patescibacteria group bacterium]